MASISYDDISSGATAADNDSPAPTLRRPSWNQIVRGGESEHQQHLIPFGDSQSHLAAAVTMSASGMEVNAPGSSLRVLDGDDGGVENGGRVGGGEANGKSGKKPAWKKPQADVTVHVVEAVGCAVMGAESWPALSGSTRPCKAPGLGVLKGSVDGLPLGQGSGPPSVSQKQADDTVVANSSRGYSSPSRQSQRSTKRGGPISASNGILAMEPPASPGSPADSRASNPSPRYSNSRSGVSSNSHGGSELLQQQRNSFRNRNGGTHSHGDGNHRQNFGSRRDQERSNQDWNHRNVNSSRDNHAPQQRGPQRYGRSAPPPPPPMPGPAPFISSVPLRAYGGPIAFPELQSQYYIYPLQSPTFYPSIPPQLIYQPPLDNTVHARILSQIDYYFSNENLVKDIFLRRNMDEQGWVPIFLIARFNKVSQLTDNVQIILDTLHHSIVVEVQGDKIRKRNDWRKWIMPAANPLPDTANSRSPDILSPDRAATGFQSLSLDGRETHHGAAASQPHVRAEASRRLLSWDLSVQGETEQLSLTDSHPTATAVGTGQ